MNWQASKPTRNTRGELTERGGKTFVTIQWKDAPAFYINQCLDQKDKFDLDSFQEMFEILKIVSM